MSKVGGKKGSFPSCPRDITGGVWEGGGNLRHLESKNREMGLALGRQGLKKKKMTWANTFEVREMVQWIKVLAAKVGDLNSLG